MEELEQTSDGSKGTASTAWLLREWQDLGRTAVS